MPFCFCAGGLVGVEGVDIVYRTEVLDVQIAMRRHPAILMVEQIARSRLSSKCQDYELLCKRFHTMTLYSVRIQPGADEDLRVGGSRTLPFGKLTSFEDYPIQDFCLGGSNTIRLNEDLQDDS